jgi:hypothetical protein
MNSRENISMRGQFIIEARDAHTGELIKCWHIDNTLMNINQEVRTKMLLGSYTGGNNALAIRYFAFGTGENSGENTPSPEDTKLVNEVYRKQVTQITSPSAGVVQSVVSLGSQEANYNLTEIGVFCGDAAVATENSGTLISRIAFNFQKNTNVVLNIIRTDTCVIS